VHVTGMRAGTENRRYRAVFPGGARPRNQTPLVFPPIKPVPDWLRRAAEPLEGGVIGSNRERTAQRILPELLYERDEGEQLFSCHVVILLVFVI